MVCRSMLASDIGEMDSARFRLSLGVSLGLGNRDTGEKKYTYEFSLRVPYSFSSSLLLYGAVCRTRRGGLFHSPLSCASLSHYCTE